MGICILAKRVVLELGSSTNFVYSLQSGESFPAPFFLYVFCKFFCPGVSESMVLVF